MSVVLTCLFLHDKHLSARLGLFVDGIMVLNELYRKHTRDTYFTHKIHIETSET